MRDDKLTFKFPNTTATANVFGNTGTVGGTTVFTLAGSSGTPSATSNELNYGGLVTNGVSGAVMDSNADGVVNADDYVRGQIIRPLYLNIMLSALALVNSQTVTVEYYSSNTLGFTPGAGNLTQSVVLTAPASGGPHASLDESVVFTIHSYSKFHRVIVKTSAASGTSITLARAYITNSREGSL
jgi:hypothetical protein